MTTTLAPLVSVGRAGAAGQQGGLAGGIEEGDGGAGNAVIGAENQRRAVAAVDGQVGRCQAAPGEREAGRQGDGRRHVEGAEAAGVFDGGGEANEVAAIDIGDAAVDGSEIGDAAGERWPALPAAAQVPVVPLTTPALPAPTATTPCLIASTGSAMEAILTTPLETRCAWAIVVNWSDCPKTVNERLSAKGWLPTVRVNCTSMRLPLVSGCCVAAKIENQRVAGADGH